MKIDLCKLLGVEEGEEFVIETKDGWYNDLKYKIENNIIKVATIKYSVYSQSSFGLNDFKLIEKIIKLPKKKQFSQDELCILRNIDKEYKWIARDKRNTLYVFKKDEPFTTGTVWNNYSGGYARFPYDDIFKSISWEDKKAIRIDDCVVR